MFSMDFVGFERVEGTLQKLAVLNLQPLMAKLGTRLKENTQLNFALQQTPFGEPWKPSKAATREGRRTLIDTTRLVGSIKAVTGNDYAEVGTNVPYGKTLQLTWAWLGVGQRDESAIAKETLAYFEGLLK